LPTTRHRCNLDCM